MSSTTTAPTTPEGQSSLARDVWTRLIQPVITGVLPSFDLRARHRMRRDAKSLVALKTWPGEQATSAHAAQLAMLRLLYLQREIHRAVRGRHREASIMLARASVETLLTGLWCLRDPDAIERLDATALKGLADALSVFEDRLQLPAGVVRKSIAQLGPVAAGHLNIWRDIVTVIDNANGNDSAAAIYRIFYAPLSNFTIHAGGGTLMRHIRRGDRLRQRPVRAWNRRSPARIADAATGAMAAALAREASKPDVHLAAYAERHGDRAILPAAVMALFGASGSARAPAMLPKAIGLLREGRTYLRGRGAAETVDVRASWFKAKFGRALDPAAVGLPAGALDPFIDAISDALARSIPEPGTAPPADSGAP